MRHTAEASYEIGEINAASL